MMVYEWTEVNNTDLFTNFDTQCKKILGNYFGYRDNGTVEYKSLKGHDFGLSTVPLEQMEKHSDYYVTSIDTKNVFNDTFTLTDRNGKKLTYTTEKFPKLYMKLARVIENDDGVECSLRGNNNETTNGVKWHQNPELLEKLLHDQYQLQTTNGDIINTDLTGYAYSVYGKNQSPNPVRGAEIVGIVTAITLVLVGVVVAAMFLIPELEKNEFISTTENQEVMARAMAMAKIYVF